MGYGHLNIDEREVILKMQAQQSSMRQIGERLSRDAGTISRELSRNVSSTYEYKPHLAQRYYERRRAESKEPYRLEEDVFLREYVEKKLKEYWSPEQISSRIKEDQWIQITRTPMACCVSSFPRAWISAGLCNRFDKLTTSQMLTSRWNY